MKTILLTDGEFTGMIRTLRSLSEPVRIAGFVSDENSAHTAMLDCFAAAPSWKDESYISFLIDYVKKEHVDYVFPIVTTGLLLMAENAGRVQEETGAVVITSKPESIRIANNKALLFDTLSRSGLSEIITPFYTVRIAGELRRAVSSFEEHGIQCISKPVCGENAEGFMRFVTEKEYAKKRLLGEAASLAVLSSFDCMNDEEQLPEERLVMPYLPGDEWDVDVLSENGSITAATVRKNLQMFGGLSACTVTVDRPDLLEYCRRIVRCLGLEYLSCISFRADENGAPKLLEINPRVMGSIHLSTLAGNNLAEKLFSSLESAEKTEYSGKTENNCCGTKNSETAVTRPGFTASLYYDLIPVTGTAGAKPDGEKTAHETEKMSFTQTEEEPGDVKGQLCWKELTPSVKELYEHYYNKVNSRITDIVFNCRFAWDSYYNFRWTVLCGCFIQASYGGKHSSPFLLMPLGCLSTEKLEKIINTVREDFRCHGLPLTVYGIDEEYLPMFEAISIPHEPAVCNDDFSDYLYDAEALRTLAGRKYAKKRNHLSHFLKEHPDFVYESINSSHFEGCLELVRKWAGEKEADIDDPDSSDYHMIEKMLSNWELLDARGGVILIEGKVAAFSLGSYEKDTAFIHFEKADASVDGLYAAINQLVLKNEFPDAVFVNREEDLGIPGLRRAKQSYYPAGMVKKYKMRIL